MCIFEYFDESLYVGIKKMKENLEQLSGVRP